MDTEKILVFFLLLLNVSTIGYSYYRISELDQTISTFETEIDELRVDKMSLEDELGNTRELVETLSEPSTDLKDPSWNELKTFLDIDETNELVYRNGSFDCSGFAIELYKNARAAGFNAAIVEVVFENEIGGHALNAFNTTDMGLVFIDENGNEYGTGKDGVAFVEEDELYGTIVIDKIDKTMVDCDMTCPELVDGLEYTSFDNMFDYDYFRNFKNCQDIYTTCVYQYNEEVADFNSGERDYTYTQLMDWNDNLLELQERISMDDSYAITVMQNRVENVEIYW